MDRIAQEEIFGPVLSVIPVDDYGAAVTALNQTRYGLSSAIFTRDVNTAFRAMRDFETGIVYVNAGTTGAETHLPFGGMKETGNGHREAGHAALDTYTEWKSIYVDFTAACSGPRSTTSPTDAAGGPHTSRYVAGSCSARARRWTSGVRSAQCESASGNALHVRKICKRSAWVAHPAPRRASTLSIQSRTRWRSLRHRCGDRKDLRASEVNGDDAPSTHPPTTAAMVSTSLWRANHQS